MSLAVSNQRGFTLVELLLSMTLFTTVMVICTAGFIAMNRSFTRGTVRKQLSEAVQRTTEDITRTLRTMPQNTVAQAQKQGDWAVLCLAGGRYFWPTAAEATGLYRDTSSCTDSVSTSKNKIELVDARYHVAALKVDSIKMADAAITDQLSGALFRVSGTFTTSDSDALQTSDPSDPSKLRCKGSVLSSAVRTCAVEHFSFIINARGAIQ